MKITPILREVERNMHVLDFSPTNLLLLYLKLEFQISLKTRNGLNFDSTEISTSMRFSSLSWYFILVQKKQVRTSQHEKN